MASDQEDEPTADGADPGAPLAAVARLTLAAEQAAVLRGALKSGFLARCARPVTVGQLARASGLNETRTRDLCAALRALGTLAPDGQGRLVVTEDYAPLLAGGADKSALAQLESSAVRQEQIGRLFADRRPGWYWRTDAGSRRAFAAGVTFEPATDLARSLVGVCVSGVAEWRDAFTSGARYLELGCGVAGALLTYLQLYPKVTAVGVELAGDLIEDARAQAAALGVADRVRFVAGDAAAFIDPVPFDVVFWSQFFFPQASRPGALATALARLRSGGLLVAPVLGTGTAVSATDDAAPDEEASLDALLFRSLDVPIISGPGLASEFEAAGFVNAQVHDIPLVTVVTARRP